MSKILFPIGYYPDPTKLGNLALGYLYIGEPDTIAANVAANQKAVTAMQEDGTKIGVAQPISLSAGGLPQDDSGNDATLFVDGEYSILAYNANDEQKYYINTVSTNASDVTYGTGSTARSVDDKLDERVSIADFGADPANADNYDEIMAAIASLPKSSNKTYGKLYIPTGEFKYNQTIAIAASGLTIEGDGDGSALICTADTTAMTINDQATLTAASATGISYRCQLNNFTIGYNVGGDDSGTDCIDPVGAVKAALVLGYLGKSSFTNFFVSGSYGGNSAPWIGIYCTGTSECAFTGVHISGCAKHGMQLGIPAEQTVLDTTLIDCNFASNGGHGLYIYNLSAVADGLAVEGVFVDTCVFADNTESGIKINQASTRADDGYGGGNYFFDNAILDLNHEHGLSVSVATGCGLNNLVIHDVWSSTNGLVLGVPTLGYGIIIQVAGTGFVTDYEIHGGFILQNANDGILTAGNLGKICDLNIFNNSNAITETSYGINILGDDNLVANNRIYNRFTFNTLYQKGILVQSGITGTDINNNYLDVGNGVSLAGTAVPFLDQGTGTRAHGNTGTAETLTDGAGQTLIVYDSTTLNSTAATIAGTLGSGQYIGQIKTIVMTGANTSSTITVTNHDNTVGEPPNSGAPTGDGEVGTFDAADEAWVLLWTGTEWTTLRATCTFV